MSRPRRNYTAVFKSKVALVALKGYKTIAELSRRFYVHPNQISQWKTQVLERAGALFEGRGRTVSPPVNIEAPHAKLGKLIVENDLLESALNEADLLSAIRWLIRHAACRLRVRGRSTEDHRTEIGRKLLE